MFKEGSFDEITFKIASEGMNQYISEDVLNNVAGGRFCYSLENILATPLGSGTIRFGTKLLKSLNNPEYKIIEAFEFFKQNGSKQAVLYVQYHKQDLTVNNPLTAGQAVLNFNSADNSSQYKADTFVKVLYTLDGVNNTLYGLASNVVVNENNDVSITFSDNYFPATGNIQIIGVYYPRAKILVYDYETDAVIDTQKQDLAVDCIPRSDSMAGKLVICNGIDKLMSWDGVVIEEIYDWVKEISCNSFNRIDNNNFSFVKTPGFIVEKYFNGNNIQLFVNNAETILTINNVSVNNDTVTITTAENVPVFDGQSAVELFYKDYPPRLSFIKAMHDRLWGIGEGAAGIQYRTKQERLKVYFCYQEKSISNWFDERTKQVPFLELTYKHGKEDNLEAICQVNNLTLFVGRKLTQVWSGTKPPLDNDADFSWQYNVPTGIPNGNLIINLANDTYFVTESGIQSASTLNVAKQLAATSLNSVNPLVKKYLSNISMSNVSYRACRAFKYTGGNIAGFKIGNNKLLVSLFDTSLYSWSLFSGDFQNSGAITTVGNTLLLAVGNKIYTYADGNDGTPKLYGDRNGASIIPFSWVTKQNTQKNRFANRRYELYLKYSSNISVNPTNQIFVSVSNETQRTQFLQDKCEFKRTGDVIGSVPIGQSRLGNNKEVFNRRLKFNASKFWVTVHGYVIDGPIEFEQLKLYGVRERYA